jgi:hypothetical protein
MLYEKLIKRNKCIREAVNNENGFNFEFEEDIIIKKKEDDYIIVLFRKIKVKDVCYKMKNLI